MNPNKNKGRAYKMVMSKMKESHENNDIFHLIGLIASCESIISDRLESFLINSKNEKYIKIYSHKKRFLSLSELLKLSKSELNYSVELKKSKNKIETQNLYSEIIQWKAKRNEIIHSVCKSKSIEIHKTETKLLQDAKSICIEGHRILRFILKWSQSLKL